MERIAVLGLGLIGGSLALALRKTDVAEQIVGYDLDPGVTHRARERGVVTHACATPEEAVQRADMVILATPILTLPIMFERIAPVLRPGTLVTDTASTKAQVVAWAQQLLPPHATFVGGHPMAGKELSGIDAAEAELLTGCTYCLTPRAQTPAEAINQFSNMITLISARPLITDAIQHDYLVAAISHLPFVLSSALVRMLGQDEEWAQLALLAAGGYRDMSRLSAGSPSMYHDICRTNREAILHWLDRLVLELESVRSIIADGDERLEDYFAQAKQVRSAIHSS